MYCNDKSYETRLVLGVTNLIMKKNMNKLEKKDGIYYTQNVENLPIEERVFFREGKGISATSENYRQATVTELAAWEEYKKQQEKEFEA